MLSRVYLTGFMTSGKSTIGPILANVLGWDFYDLDRVIEQDESMAVVDIFKNNGEQYFREKETETLTRLTCNEKAIISLGGGTIANKTNFDLMRESGLIVYLKVSPEVLYNRLKNKIDRPLFRDLVLEENPKEAFLDRINDLLAEREKYYCQADIVIDSDSTKVGVTVDQLAKELKKIEYEESKCKNTR